MNRLLLKEELDKLSSTDGIIELLCGIPNFKSDDYDELNIETRDLVDYTMSIKLLSDSQINGNLRRSMDAGNLALISQRKLTALSLLYFGIKDENGKYAKYVCPYTGKEYNLEDVRKELNKPYNTRNIDKTLELEHIMPHSAGGGTVLFNCIPASKEANSVAEKGNLHLLDWLSNPESSGYKYYENGGAERLNKLVNYMLSAYEISFEEYEESELEFNYDNTGEIEEGIDNEEDIEINDRKVDDNKKKIRETSIDGDIPFLNQLINQLEKEGYETKDIKNKLVELEEKGIINNLEKYTKVQKTIEELFKKEDSKSYLTYSLNVDYIKLVNSIETDEPEEIKKTLTKRFEQIKQLTETNGKSIKDYFISLKDIQDIDILYKEEISENDIEIFINNIKLGHDGKIDLFIEMLSEDKYTGYKKLGNGQIGPDENNIFKSINETSFKGYENITGLNTSHFWIDNSDEIKARIKELKKKENLTEEEEKKLEKAEQAIDCYEFKNNLERRIDCFIEMLSEDKYVGYEKGVSNDNNIFKKNNEVSFKGYENITGLNTSSFWKRNSIEIISRLFYNTDSKGNKLENDYSGPEYDKARKAILEYAKVESMDEYIDKMKSVKKKIH